jgi:hypothetical protein
VAARPLAGKPLQRCQAHSWLAGKPNRRGLALELFASKSTGQAEASTCQLASANWPCGGSSACRQAVAALSGARLACGQAEPKGPGPSIVWRQVAGARSGRLLPCRPAIVGLEAPHPLAGKAHHRRSVPKRSPDSASPIHPGHGACRIAAKALAEAALPAGTSPGARARAHGIRGKSPTDASTHLPSGRVNVVAFGHAGENSAQAHSRGTVKMAARQAYFEVVFQGSGEARVRLMAV